MKRLFVVAGCNGAGKTTASYTILPEILNCREFVNADEIARGLSPFQPEKAGIDSARLMLKRIKNFIESGKIFAFETTLSTKSYVSLLKEAKQKGYEITLMFFWLSSPELAVLRVKTRVKEGGHHIDENIVKRRYERGLFNFYELYLPIVDSWMLIDNSGEPYQIIAEGNSNDIHITNAKIWEKLKSKYYG
ncbi:MAG: zeta toxin family protein [Cyclobacteriaceae bacterium]